jgi:hypothetical protein
MKAFFRLRIQDLKIITGVEAAKLSLAWKEADELTRILAATRKKLESKESQILNLKS